MDNQLSLFGFEEPVAPQQSSQKEKEQTNQPAAQETENDIVTEKEDIEPEVKSQQQDVVTNNEKPLSADHKSSEVAFEAETNKAESFLNNELNEVVQPNKGLVTVETLIRQAAVEYPIYEPKVKEDIAEITEENAVVDQEESEITTPILDEVIVPNEEVFPVNEIEEKEIETTIPENKVEQPITEIEEVTPALLEVVPDESVEESVILDKEELSEEKKPESISPIDETEFSNIVEKQEEEDLHKQEPVAALGNSFGKKGRKSFKEIDAEVDLIQVPSDDVLFSKQYYPISQVAKWFRVNNSLLRFWENEFDILKPRKNRKGDRLFRPEDVKSLQIIYYLLRQKKYTIAGARKFIKNNRKTVDVNMKIVHTLNDFKRFLLELKANTER